MIRSLLPRNLGKRLAELHRVEASISIVQNIKPSTKKPAEKEEGSSPTKFESQGTSKPEPAYDTFQDMHNTSANKETPKNK